MARSLAVLLVGLVGCGVFGASDGDEPRGGLPPGAPPPVVGTPTDEELTERFGVFVTPSGRADGDGSRFAPVATIAQGVALATPKLLRVYVCAGTYAEAITMASGVSILGGYDCSNPNAWRRGGARSRVAPATIPVVTARDIDRTTRFAGFEVVAPEGHTQLDPPSPRSSIAFFARNAGALTVADARIVAQRAGDGAPGVEPPQLSLPATATGGGGTADSGAFSPSGLLVIKRQAGGAGGAGACVGAPGVQAGVGGAGGFGGGYTCPNSGVGNWALFTNTFGVQQSRSDGAESPTPAATAGSDGLSATRIGTLTEAGAYVPRYTTAGGSGTAGKGGRGGDGALGPVAIACTAGQGDNAASGSGGGAGGCPGIAGSPGESGGASIAAIVAESEGLTFDGVALEASDGGAGGAGTLGSEATAGGAPGGGVTSGGVGLAGSPGGRAGVSGSGAGGPSIALAHMGPAPRLINGTTTKVGKPGPGVAARSRPDDGLGNARTLPASADGIAVEVHPFENPP